jgi:hypothetical protein
VTRPRTLGLMPIKTRNSGRGLERSGVVGRVKRTRVVPPAARRVADPRPPRDYAAQNARLIARGDVDSFVDWNSLAGRGEGRGAKTGRPYTNGTISLIVALMVFYHLPLRQAEGTAQREMRRLGLGCRDPSYSTICRRRRGLSFELPRLRKGSF